MNFPQPHAKSVMARVSSQVHCNDVLCRHTHLGCRDECPAHGAALTSHNISMIGVRHAHSKTAFANEGSIRRWIAGGYTLRLELRIGLLTSDMELIVPGTGVQHFTPARHIWLYRAPSCTAISRLSRLNRKRTVGVQIYFPWSRELHLHPNRPLLTVSSAH